MFWMLVKLDNGVVHGVWEGRGARVSAYPLGPPPVCVLACRIFYVSSPLSFSVFFYFPYCQCKGESAAQWAL